MKLIVSSFEVVIAQLKQASITQLYENVMINAIKTTVVSSPTHIHHRHNFAKPHLSQRLEDALEAACALRKNPKKRIFLQEEDEGALFRVTTQNRSQRYSK